MRDASKHSCKPREKGSNASQLAGYDLLRRALAPASWPGTMSAISKATVSRVELEAGRSAPVPERRGARPRRRVGAVAVDGGVVGIDGASWPSTGPRWPSAGACWPSVGPRWPSEGARLPYVGQRRGGGGPSGARRSAAGGSARRRVDRLLSLSDRKKPCSVIYDLWSVIGKPTYTPPACLTYLVNQLHEMIA